MFINSKKCFEICEGDKKLVIPRNFIGSIPYWAANHWLVQAAIKDGSIATPENASDKGLEKADALCEGKAAGYDQRPDNSAQEDAAEPKKADVKKTDVKKD